MRTIALLEFEVRGAARGAFTLDGWHQRYLRYAPYDEVYFSLDRQRVLARAFQRPDVTDFALAFYIHFFDVRRPVVTPYGNIKLPKPVSPRPPHLAGLQYAYWD